MSTHEEGPLRHNKYLFFLTKLTTFQVNNYPRRNQLKNCDIKKSFKRVAKTIKPLYQSTGSLEFSF